MPRRRACAAALALIVLALGAPVAAAPRWIAARAYEYGGNHLGDEPGNRPIAWVWRSENDLEACRRGILARSAARGETGRDLFAPPACGRGRIGRVEHRQAVDLMEADAACGRMATIDFTPDQRDRLVHVSGCLPRELLSESPPPPPVPGSWVLCIDIGQAGGPGMAPVQRIASYPSWRECEIVRKLAQKDLLKEGDPEALEAARFVAGGACLPEEMVE